ncbi:MAG TPA: hypothetical protein VGV85_15400 [Longimicrobiaceae bacterium]|nr:hypothetical protein [Longimicrobiaceae bacterium]
MRLTRMLSGAMLGVALLSLATMAVPALADSRSGTCEEYGSFVCCRTDTDARCVQVAPLEPAT